MNFVDEKNVAFLQAGQKSGEIAGFFDGGSGGGADGGIHFRAEDVGESGFPESGRTAEEKVVEGLGTGAGGIEEYAEAVFEFGLSGKVGQAGWPEGLIHGVTGLGVELFQGLPRHGSRMA